jgi:hypothetical protein
MVYGRALLIGLITVFTGALGGGLLWGGHPGAAALWLVVVDSAIIWLAVRSHVVEASAAEASPGPQRLRLKTDTRSAAVIRSGNWQPQGGEAM